MRNTITKKGKSYLRKLSFGAAVFLNVLALSSNKAQAQNVFPSSGNVGIGTTSPSYSLHIKNYTPLIYLEDNNKNYSFMYHDYLGNLRFHTMQGMFLLSKSGNLGVGTGSPESRLHVHSSTNNAALISSSANSANLEIRGTGTSSMPMLTLSNTNKSLYSTIYMDLNGGIRVSTQGGSSYFSKNGDLGIGTFTPASKLHIYDSSKDAVLRLQSAFYGRFGSSAIEFWSNPSNDVDEWRPAVIRSFDDGGFTGGLTFFTNGSGSDSKTNMKEAMRMIDGKVIIGDEENNLDISNSDYSMFVKKGILTEGLKVADANIGKLVIGDEDNDLDITSPNYSMFVKKGILTERLKVAVANSSNWADYVFDKNYKLAKLNEVENYIQENKHLPGIPSSEEMVENGMDVLQMNAKLLEKIEELTLYTIELNKKYEALEKKVNESSKK